MDTKIKKADFIFIGVLTVFLILFFLIFSYVNYGNLNSDGKYVSVTVEGEEIFTAPLDKDCVQEIQNVGLLKIYDNTVCLYDVDCNDKICENMGPIKYIYQTIICLPNKTIVRILGGSSEDIDGIVG